MVNAKRSQPKIGFFLILSLRDLITYSFNVYLFSLFVFIQAGTGLSGSGTLAFGVLDKLLTLPCGVSR